MPHHNTDVLDCNSGRILHNQFSFLNFQIKSQIIEQIQQLNGELNTTLDPNQLFTHLICESVGKSEKTFSAIASGAWILHTKYITDSVQAGHFLDVKFSNIKKSIRFLSQYFVFGSFSLQEELYEFGNPKFIVTNADNQNKKISKGAYFWRKRLQEQKETGKKVGAFVSFRVILHVLKKDLMKILIESGGGEVLSIT